MVDSFRGVEDPNDTEIAELNYDQNPVDPSQVIRNITFKKNDIADGSGTGN